MKAILAVDESMGIGKDGKIPWNFKEDMKFFKFLTIGSVVVMGRKTYEDCGTLPHRTNIVVSSSLKRINNAFVYPDLLHCAWEYMDAFIIGGAKLLELAFKEDLINELFLSRIKGRYNCDTFINLPTDMLKVSELKLSENVIVEKWIV